MTASNLLWLFLHIPKTGGTTINGHLSQHLVFDKTHVILGGWGNRYRREHGLVPWTDRPLEERSTVRVLAGQEVVYGHHELFPERRPRYFTVLRDPADRIVSRFNFDRSWGRTEQDFEPWYTEVYRPRRQNFQVHFLADRLDPGRPSGDDITAFARAVELLRRCWFVGVTEHLDEDLPRLFAAMGLPPSFQSFRKAGVGKAFEALPDRPRPQKRVERITVVDEALRQRLHADHPLEVKLYEHARRWRTERAPW